MGRLGEVRNAKFKDELFGRVHKGFDKTLSIPIEVAKHNRCYGRLDSPHERLGPNQGGRSTYLDAQNGYDFVDLVPHASAQFLRRKTLMGEARHRYN